MVSSVPKTATRQTACSEPCSIFLGNRKRPKMQKSTGTQSTSPSRSSSAYSPYYLLWQPFYRQSLLLEKVAVEQTILQSANGHKRRREDGTGPR